MNAKKPVTVGEIDAIIKKLMGGDVMTPLQRHWANMICYMDQEPDLKVSDFRQTGRTTFQLARAIAYTKISDVAFIAANMTCANLLFKRINKNVWPGIKTGPYWRFDTPLGNRFVLSYENVCTSLSGRQLKVFKDHLVEELEAKDPEKVPWSVTTESWDREFQCEWIHADFVNIADMVRKLREKKTAPVRVIPIRKMRMAPQR